MSDQQHPEPLSASSLVALFGKIAFREHPHRHGMVIPSTPWVSANIRRIFVPALHHVQPGGLINVHHKIIRQTERAWRDVVAADLMGLVLTWDGSYVPRHKGWDPKRSLSSHAWGIAFDINARWNGYGATPAAWKDHGTVRPLVAIFERHGFAWGGWWTKRYKDGMHFECYKVIP